MDIPKKKYSFIRLTESRHKINDKVPAGILQTFVNGILFLYFFQLPDGSLGILRFENETPGNQHINACLD